LADVLAWEGRHREATERLGALYARDPKDVEVLLRLGRLSRWRGDRKAALRYYREALVADPGNQEAHDAYQILIDETNYRLETGYGYEDFNFTTSTHAPYVELLYTDNRRLTLLGRAEYQRKFAADNTRFSFGATRKLGERTWLRGEVGFAPGSDVLARQDYQVEVSHQVSSRMTAGMGYRFLTFGVADAHALTVLADSDLRLNLHLSVRYLPARTRFGTVPGAVWNHSGWARLTWDVNKTWSPYVVFAVGSESFSALSADLLGRFAAQTYGFGTTVHIRRDFGFRVGYFHQNRTQERRQDSLTLAYFMRF
jgi:YaiO family outer membrane protein